MKCGKCATPRVSTHTCITRARKTHFFGGARANFLCRAQQRIAKKTIVIWNVMYTNDDEDDDMARVGPLVLVHIGLMLNAKASTLSRKINNGLKTNIASHIRTNIINVRIETYIAHSSVFFSLLTGGDDKNIQNRKDMRGCKCKNKSFKSLRCCAFTSECLFFTSKHSKFALHTC